MNAAVLCSGPSLSQTWKGRDGYGFVAGVNRAAHRGDCDAWVCCDPHPVQQLPLRLFTTQYGRDVLAGEGRTFAGGRIDVMEGYPFAPYAIDGNPWMRFSATAALIYAASQGAKQIDVYGADWKPDAPDFDGVMPNFVARDTERWREEAELWNTVTRWLASRGCEVRRIAPT